MDNLSKFAENLSALMEERGLNAPTLAKELKTDRSNITRYLQGERFPVFSGFIAIIDYFHVSADVILGLLDYSAQTDFLPILPFGQRLREVMNETGTTQYRIEKTSKSAAQVCINGCLIKACRAWKTSSSSPNTWTFR